MLMCGVGAKSVAHLMKFHLLQWEVVEVKFLMNSTTVLILGISKSGGDPPPLHKMWGRG